MEIFVVTEVKKSQQEWLNITWAQWNEIVLGKLASQKSFPLFMHYLTWDWQLSYLPGSFPLDMTDFLCN